MIDGRLSRVICPLGICCQWHMTVDREEDEASEEDLELRNWDSWPARLSWQDGPEHVLARYEGFLGAGGQEKVESRVPALPG